MKHDPRLNAMRVYAWLLRLYPRAFREEFGGEMLAFFGKRLEAAQARGQFLEMVRFWKRMLVDLARCATLEHVAALEAFRSGGVQSHTFAHSPSVNRTGDSMLQTIAYDTRHTLRALRRSPVFTAVALLVIALGTGAVTTIFSAANSLVMRPLPGTTNSRALLEVHRTDKAGTGSLTLSASYPYFKNLREHTRTLNGLAAWSMVQLTVSRNREGVSSLGNIVSANYFDVMGARPALGRFFVADEERVPGASAVVVLSYGFWQRVCAGDSAIVGSIVQVNGHPFTVVGVAQREFHGVYPLLNTDVWVPVMMQDIVRPGTALLTSTGAGWLELVGRARPGISQETIRAELATLTESFAKASEPASFRKMSGVRVATLFGLPSESKGPIMGFTALLLGVSALVLLIASANVAGMLLARAAARRREMALRVALGAARARIVRQLLTEHVLLFVLGGMGGLALAYLACRGLQQLPIPAELPLSLNLTPDGRVLLFTLVVSLATGLTFGLAPALAASRADVSSQLRNDTAGAGSRRSRLRSSLVIGQLALSLVLLVSAGLFVRALDKGLRVNPGFRSANVTVAPFDARSFGYSVAQSRAFYDDLKTRLLSHPGVGTVSYTQLLPLSSSNSGSEYHIDGYAAAGEEAERGVGVLFSQVDPDYFAALGIPLVKGRAFLNSDAPGAVRVAIVNEAFAKKYWPGRNAIGGTFREDSTVFTVVGVVANSMFAKLNEGPRPFVYFPIAQSWNSTHHLIVTSTLDIAMIARLVRDEVRAIDANLPIPTVTTLDAVTSVMLLPQRLAASVTAAFGVLGLVLAAVGLYGIIAYSVSQRTREIGVRMALGATSGNVVGLVLRDALRLVFIGLSIGLVLAMATTRLLSTFLFGVSATDAVTFAGILVLLSVVAMLASYVPARRAAATNPLEALRAE